MKKLNWKNLIKLLMLAYCTGIIVYDFVCISILFATFTWFGFVEFIAAFIIAGYIAEDLFKKKRTS